jgi:hypothetical protein
MQVIVLIDRSGSMNGKQADVIGGFKTFLEEQRNLDAQLTLIQFDDKYEHLLTEHISTFPASVIDNYKPRGGTALRDAIGKAINEATEKKVLFVVITDGEENQSVEFSPSALKALITEKEDAGWKFIYMGANQDSFTSAQDLGISKGMAVNYCAANTTATMRGLSYASASYHAGTLDTSVLASIVSSPSADTSKSVTASQFTNMVGGGVVITTPVTYTTNKISIGGEK